MCQEPTTKTTTAGRLNYRHASKAPRMNSFLTWTFLRQKRGNSNEIIALKGAKMSGVLRIIGRIDKF
jgi:hypothetical protein